MAVVVVFYPLRVFSTSPSALRNPVGIQHTVLELFASEQTGEERALAMCGQRIGFQLFDTEFRRGHPRPTKPCDNCRKQSTGQDVVPFIGVSDACWSDVPEQAADTGQGTLL